MSPPTWITSSLLIGVAVVLGWTCWRFARRTAATPSQAAVDAMLLFMLCQYGSVLVSGICGLLSGQAVAVISVAVSGLLWAKTPNTTPPPIGWPGKVMSVILLGVCLSQIWIYRWTPPTANDALIYHLPAAVQWLQDGRITFFETWVHNPSNTWSPLGASAMAAWSMALGGHDLVAKFVQLPAFLLICAATWSICRALGAGGWSTLLLTLAVAFCRPMIGQIAIAKDDLIANALFLAAAASLTQAALKSPGSAWRFGVAVGLLAGTKYTVAYLLVPLLVAVDAPWRGGKRWQWYATALTIPLLLAGPWYVRNLILTGNPLFPIHLPFLNGFLETERAEELDSLASIWHVLTGTYFGIPPLLVVSLAAGWLGTAITARRWVSDPLLRLCVAGPVVLLGFYLMTSPFVEVRFIIGAAALLACALAASKTGRLIAPLVAVAAVCTAYRLDFVGEFVLILLPALAISTGLLAATQLTTFRRSFYALSSVATVGALCLIFVFHGWMLRTYRQSTDDSWANQYGRIGEAWAAMRNNVNTPQKIVYAGTNYVYPIQDFVHQVRFISPAPEIEHLDQLPPLGKLPSNEVDRAVLDVLYAHANRETWFQRLERYGPTYVFISKEPRSTPELGWAREAPDRFSLVFENEAAAIFLFRAPSQTREAR